MSYANPRKFLTSQTRIKEEEERKKIRSWKWQKIFASQNWPILLWHADTRCISRPFLFCLFECLYTQLRSQYSRKKERKKENDFLNGHDSLSWTVASSSSSSSSYVIKIFCIRFIICYIFYSCFRTKENLRRFSNYVRTTIWVYLSNLLKP